MNQPQIAPWPPHPAPAPAPHPAPAPAPHPAPFPAPFPAPHPAPFPAPHPAPFPAPHPAPFPTPHPAPLPAPAPHPPAPAPQPAPPHLEGYARVEAMANMATTVNTRNFILLDGQIYDADFTYTAGGVARNMCESLCKLGFSPNFLTVIGADQQGRVIKSGIPSQSRHFVTVDHSRNTAECIIVFDNTGSCRMLMGDMKIHSKITPQMILENERLIKSSPLIILDANLSEEALGECLKMATKYNIPVFFEPTDVAPSTKPFGTPYWKAIKFMTPNLKELEHITGFLNILPQKSTSEIEKAAYLGRKLLDRGIDNVIVTLGSKGILIARKGLASDNFDVTNRASGEHVRFYPTESVEDLVNVSGAGDCFASGFVAALISKMPEEICVSVGFAAARLALQSQAAVPKEIFDRSHQSWESPAPYQTIL